MTEQNKTKDPGAIFQEYMNEMEGNWARMWDQVVASPWYSRFQGNLMDTILSTQQASQTNIRKYLESLNIPTRDDLARVSSQVIQAEQKIDQLEQGLQSLKNIEAKLDVILSTLDEDRTQVTSEITPKPAAKTTPRTTSKPTSKATSKPRTRRTTSEDTVISEDEES